MVPPRVWWTAIKGFFSFGSLPAPGPDGQVNWLLLGAFAAYAGSGGLGNVTITNYVRDKRVGYEQPRGCDPIHDRRTERDPLALGQGVSHLTRKPQTVQRMVEIRPI